MPIARRAAPAFLNVDDCAHRPESAPRVKPRRDYHMSIERARRQLGFEPSVSIEVGMAEQLAWLRSTSAQPGQGH